MITTTLEKALKTIAQTVPSGGNTDIRNAHDLPNIVDLVTPGLLENRSIHYEDVRKQLIEYGQDSAVARSVTDVIEIVGFAIGAVKRHS